ncbi:hypothetical protein ACFFX0_08920 [Citricoccus parietis]|uniref:Uncharacterized protein n=1 Tax=Citricoccus parietis TaxID=592307 RepID=A0ABV5FXB1_9MICC
MGGVHHVHGRGVRQIGEGGHEQAVLHHEPADLASLRAQQLHGGHGLELGGGVGGAQVVVRVQHDPVVVPEVAGQGGVEPGPVRDLQLVVVLLAPQRQAQPGQHHGCGHLRGAAVLDDAPRRQAGGQVPDVDAAVLRQLLDLAAQLTGRTAGVHEGVGVPQQGGQARAAPGHELAQPGGVGVRDVDAVRAGRGEAQHRVVLGARAQRGQPRWEGEAGVGLGGAVVGQARVPAPVEARRRGALLGVLLSHSCPSCRRPLPRPAHDDGRCGGAARHQCLIPRYTGAPRIPPRETDRFPGARLLTGGLLPLDGSRGLAGHVQDHPVDAVHLVGDAVGDP